jgi:ABC-2 type transport system ATP-binding protein
MPSDPIEALDVLTVRGLGAGYGRELVVSDVDLHLRGGDWIGLIGANGAGKTTLLRALSGQIPVARGTVSVCGVDLGRHPEDAKRWIGYAVDAEDLPVGLTGRQLIELVASVRGCAPDAWPIRDLIGMLDLDEWFDRLIKTYSYGTKKKLAIAAALLGDVRLVVLDESLNGLDPLVAWKLKRMLTDLVAGGRHAVILSTHVLDTVAQCCTQAMFVTHGGVARAWTRADLASARARPGGFEAEVIAWLEERALPDA